MSAALRAVFRFDRSYFLAITAFIAAVAASVYLSVASIYTLNFSDGSTETGTLVEVEGLRGILLLLLPPLITVVPLLVLPVWPTPITKSHKINAVSAAVLLLGIVAATIFVTGLVYVPALILSTASASALFFGKRPDQNTSTEGVRLSRRARREAARNEGKAALPSPRPGGGRRRRKR